MGPQSKSHPEEPPCEYISDLQAAKIRIVLCIVNIAYSRPITMLGAKIQLFLVIPELRVGGGRILGNKQS